LYFFKLRLFTVVCSDIFQTWSELKRPFFVAGFAEYVGKRILKVRHQVGSLSKHVEKVG